VWECYWLAGLACLSSCSADHLAPTARVEVTRTVGAAKVFGAAAARGVADAARAAIAAKAIKAAGAAKAVSAVRAARTTAGTGKPTQHCGNLWTAGSLRTRRGQ
jgi:hypothetical protein